MKKIALIVAFCLLLTGCSQLAAGPTEPSTVPTDAPVDSDMFTDRDKSGDYSAKGAVSVEFDGTSITTNSPTASVRDNTVTLTKEGVYILSGTLDDGSVIVDAGKKDKIQIVLSGASITSADDAAICVKEADKVFLTLAEGTENHLANGGSFPEADNSIDAALFSQQDLTINGSGNLTVTSPAGHGISCKDDLAITGGSYSIHSAGHGIDANDSVRIGGGTITVDAGKDGIHAENTGDATLGFVYIENAALELEAEGDGISAGAWLQTVSGSMTILAGGGSENAAKDHSSGYGDFMGGGMGGLGGWPGQRPDKTPRASTTDSAQESSSMKGLKAAGQIFLNNGQITVDSADDALHSNTDVAISGGNLTLKTGDDGIHADEALSITGGTITITESYEGLEAKNITVSGGSIRLTATDDGLNAAGGADSSGMGGMRPGGDRFAGGMGGASDGSILISGGELYVKASGDGMDANGTLSITGGYTIVTGPTQGDTSTLDFDVSGSITGGTFIGTGAAGMAQTFSESSQGVISLKMGSAAANTRIILKDKDGKELISHSPELGYNVVILSSPELTKGERYTVQIGDESAEFTAS